MPKRTSAYNPELEALLALLVESYHTAVRESESAGERHDPIAQRVYQAQAGALAAALGTYYQDRNPELGEAWTHRAIRYARRAMTVRNRHVGSLGARMP